MGNYKVEFTAETHVVASSQEDAISRTKQVFSQTLNITSASAEVQR